MKFAPLLAGAPLAASTCSQDRTRGAAQDMVRHAAHEPAPECRAAVAAHGDRLRALPASDAEDGVSGIAVEQFAASADAGGSRALDERGEAALRPLARAPLQIDPGRRRMPPDEWGWRHPRVYQHEPCAPARRERERHLEGAS